MGIFKSTKQMKEAVNGIPAMIEQAQQLQAASAQYAAQQQAAAAAAGPGGAGPGGPPAASLTDADLAPVGGVSLELYAQLSRELGERGATVDQAPALAAERGIDAADWDAAVAGWNQRMAADPAVAAQFSRLYRGA
jgi:hypothetical protein